MVTIYYDATDTALGRVASVVAKDLLKGKEVAVVNCEKCIISGNKNEIIGTITHWRGLGGIGQKGPKVSRVPHMLFKRMLRGMLPWNKTKGREAYDRLKCYTGTIAEAKDAQRIKSTKPMKFVYLSEVSRLI
jgi:large subunit ribosomal protein L13